MRYGLIELMRRSYPIALMCRVLNVSESGFHTQRTRPLCKRKRENTRLEIEMLAAHQRTRETYSAKRLHCDLGDHGVQITPYRVRALRKKLNLRCKQKLKFKVTTDSTAFLLCVMRYIARNQIVRDSLVCSNRVPTIDEHW